MLAIRRSLFTFRRMSSIAFDRVECLPSNPIEIFAMNISSKDLIEEKEKDDESRGKSHYKDSNNDDNDKDKNEIRNSNHRARGNAKNEKKNKYKQFYDDHSSIKKNNNIPFALDKEFVETFRNVKPNFGFNGLGELVYLRTYSRVKANGEKEEWFETVERVVNGTFNMQKRWVDEQGIGWNEDRHSEWAKEMYQRIFEMKFLPPGRGLWAMGSPLTEERGLFAALNNCAFVSTEDIDDKNSCISQPFTFLMDAAMLGVGVGFDVKGAGKVKIIGVDSSLPSSKYVITDNREGWVESLRLLILSYFSTNGEKGGAVEFDYSNLRPAGSPIKGFGGTASGPNPLIKLHGEVRDILQKLEGKSLTQTAIVDLFNLIGRCVVSGQNRKSAEIAFGDPKSSEYIDLKNYSVNPHRAEFGWTSNNSILAEIGMDYHDAATRIRDNGEPGFAWLNNMQKYSRMNGVIDDKDERARGGNPCLEQTLESYELCCLVETFPNKHVDIDDYKRTLEIAFLYAKTVTLGKTHWPFTNRVMLRNRRIGASMSGITQFISSRGLDELKKWCEEGYTLIQNQDKIISDMFAIPLSKKTTSIKPSGTVSLLAGATPGMHYPESRFYFRRVRLPLLSEMIKPLKRAGYHIEDTVNDPSSVVVRIPIDAGEGVRTLKEVSMWEQLSLAAFLQQYWADNQVSCTVTFDPETEGNQIQYALNYFQYKLKGVSFLPRLKSGAYPQMPYEEIDEETYINEMKKLKILKLGKLKSVDKISPEPERYCDTSACIF